MGYNFTGGRIFDFPIDFCMGLTPSPRYVRQSRPHYIILASNLFFDKVCNQVFDKFVRVCNMLSTFLSKTWSRTCCINLDMSRLMQQVRWFVCVLDKWNIEKNPFPASQRPAEAGFSLRILLFVLIVT